MPCCRAASTRCPEVVERAELGQHVLVAAFGRADRPGAADVVGLGHERVVLALAVDAADRMDRRQVEHVEAHRRDVGQARLARRRRCRARMPSPAERGNSSYQLLKAARSRSTQSGSSAPSVAARLRSGKRCASSARCGSSARVCSAAASPDVLASFLLQCRRPGLQGDARSAPRARRAGVADQAGADRARRCAGRPARPGARSPRATTGSDRPRRRRRSCSCRAHRRRTRRTTRRSSGAASPFPDTPSRRRHASAASRAAGRGRRRSSAPRPPAARPRRA